MKWITLNPDNRTIDVIYLYDPNIETCKTAPDNVEGDWYYENNQWKRDEPQPYIEGDWYYENNQWKRDEPQPYIEVPQSISRRQLLIGLTMDGLITEQEAVDAATTGQIPQILMNVISMLPTEEQLIAKITWASMSVCERNNPLLQTALTVVGKTEQELNTFFIKYSKV